MLSPGAPVHIRALLLHVCVCVWTNRYDVCRERRRKGKVCVLAAVFLLTDSSLYLFSLFVFTYSGHRKRPSVQTGARQGSQEYLLPRDRQSAARFLNKRPRDPVRGPKRVNSVARECFRSQARLPEPVLGRSWSLHTRFRAQTGQRSAPEAWPETGSTIEQPRVAGKETTPN